MNNADVNSITDSRVGELTLSTARILAQMKTSSGRSSLAELCSSFKTYGKIPTDRAWKHTNSRLFTEQQILRHHDGVLWMQHLSRYRRGSGGSQGIKPFPLLAVPFGMTSHETLGKPLRCPLLNSSLNTLLFFFTLVLSFEFNF